MKPTELTATSPPKRGYFSAPASSVGQSPHNSHYFFRHIFTRSLSRGLAGPYVSDKVGEMFGFKPTEADKEALERIKPKIQVIERSS